MKKLIRIQGKGLYYLAIANVLFFVAVIIVNYLATSLPINGLSTGELSDFYPNLFTPAGFTFSIWGIIYLFLFAFVVRQLIDLRSKNSKEITKKIGIWFILSCITNIAWIYARHYQQVFLSVIIMLMYLATLIKITSNIHIGKKLGSRKDKMFAQVPFSILLGWLSVATIANIAAWLVFSGWSMRGMTNIFWTTIVINVATILGILSLWKKQDIMYTGVIIRAFRGIVAKRMAEGPMNIEAIFRSLGIGITILLIGIIIKFNSRRKH